MKNIVSIICASVGLLAANGAQAYSTYFGEDPNSSSATPLSSIPNSSAAQTAFLSQLSGVGVETFESFEDEDSAPLTLTFPGAGTATLSGGGGEIETNPFNGTDGNGRYSIPASSSTKFWEVSAGGSNNFVVTFASPIAAFGFYGIDIGDFGGRLQLEFSSGSSVLNTLTVPNTIGANGSTDGSVLYYGAIAQNAGELFTSIRFLTTTGGGDVFAFDNFTIGSQEQVCGENCPVPEPGTLALFGLGLLGLGLTRRRKTT